MSHPSRPFLLPPITPRTFNWTQRSAVGMGVFVLHASLAWAIWQSTSSHELPSTPVLPALTLQWIPTPATPEMPAPRKSPPPTSAEKAVTTSAPSPAPKAAHRPSAVAPSTAPEIASVAPPIEAPSTEGANLPTSGSEPPNSSADDQPRHDNGTVNAPTIPSQAVQYLIPPQPRYPASSRRMGEHGQVMVRVWVTQGGLPQQVQVQESSGHARLDEAAVSAVQAARFKPYLDQGRPTAGWAFIPLVFDLEAM